MSGKPYEHKMKRNSGLVVHCDNQGDNGYNIDTVRKELIAYSDTFTRFPRVSFETARPVT